MHKQFTAKMEAASFIHSTSRIGRCIDNEPIENFWRILKAEMLKFKGLDSLKREINS